jgi:hypothetical protein
MFRRRTPPARTDVGSESGSVVEQDVVVRRGHAWSPAQIVAFVIGAASLAFGIVALVRTGLDLGDLTGPEDTVLGFVHTPLLAIAEIGFGALMLLAALSPGGRVLMAFLGAVALAFGVLILADVWSGRFHDWFAVNDDNGWLFVVVGGVSLLSALLLPTVRTRDRRHVTERRRIGDPHTVH